MPIRDILVHLDLTPRSMVRLELAAELAVRHQAYLIGLYMAHKPIRVPVGQTSAVLMEESFRGRLRQRRLEGEWRLAEGSTAEVLTRFGRCVDLTILGQPDPQESRGGLSEKGFVDILRGIGRPVLAVPYAGSFACIGERVLIVWERGPESTRALNEALPLLYSAKAVQVLVCDSGRQSDIDANGNGLDIFNHLSRHGVVAKGERLFVDKEIEKGEALLSYAADFGADMMVFGAPIVMHAHIIPAREFVLRKDYVLLLERMTVPVMMAA